MEYGNTAVVLMVVAVVAVVLALVFVGAHYLDKAADQNAR